MDSLKYAILVVVMLALFMAFSTKSSEHYSDGPYWGLPSTYPGQAPLNSVDWGLPGKSSGGMVYV